MLLPSVMCILICVPALRAQTAANLPRISGPVDESALTTFKGNVPFQARTHADLGAVPASTNLDHIRLVLSRSAAQQAALDAYEADLIDPSSPNFHKWLTPEQFGKQYGPADSDIAAVVAWLQSHGLTVEPLSPGRTNIAFSGTTQQVTEALHTSFHRFLGAGGQFTANTSDPRIPSALAGVVSGVARLNTLHPRPHNVAGAMGLYDPSRGAMTPVPSSLPGHPRPAFTTGSGTLVNPYFLNIVPGDAAVIYDTPNSAFNPNYTSGTSYTGKGVTIGIGGDAVILPATVAGYRTRFLGDTTQPIITNVNGTTSTLDTNEAYIDTEISGGLAPGATIHFYTSPDLVSGIEQAIDDNAIDIFSLSFGVCELGQTTADNALTNSWWQQAAAQGIAVTVSAGDSGSAGCDDNTTQATADYGLMVSGFASTPYNIAVGGTDLDGLITSAASFAHYVSTTNNSSNFYRTAKSYIPESSWNDSPITDRLLANNVPYIPSGGSGNIVAGSGGVSNCTVNSYTSPSVYTCTSGYPKPAWQRGTGVPSADARAIPDVSLASGDGADLAAWLVCTDDTSAVSATLTATADCSTQTDGNFYFSGYGGTSTAAPAFAGILALVQEKTGGRLGQAARELYDLYNGANAASIFHDVMLGNNSVPCTASSLNCAMNAAGYEFLTGYDTTAGYDLATGLGSVDAAQLVKYWGTGSSAVAAAVTVSPSASTITTVDPLTVTVTVAPSGALPTPTGSITLAGSNYTSAIETLASGSFAFSLAPGTLPVGTDVLTAVYNGQATDSNYAVSSGTATVTVNKAASIAAILPANASIYATAPLTISGTVTGAGPTPTGTVIISGGGYTSSPVTLSAGAYSLTIPAGSLATGADTLTATYAGDRTYQGTTATASVTVTAYITPTVIVTPTSTTSNAGQSLSVLVSVTGTVATPTGTVTLSGGGYTSATQALAVGIYTFTIPANTLATGSDTLTASYSGDTIYSLATGTATITIAASVYTLSASAPAAISAGGSGTSIVTIATKTGYSGTVTLACALTSSPSGAIDLPSCMASDSSITLNATTATATVSVSTTKAAALEKPRVGGWANAGGGAVLAMLVFLGIPARRCSWRALLGALLLMAAFCSLSACTATGSKNPGTSSGIYIFTVTGTGTPAVTPAPSTTFTLTVK